MPPHTLPKPLGSTRFTREVAIAAAITMTLGLGAAQAGAEPARRTAQVVHAADTTTLHGGSVTSPAVKPAPIQAPTKPTAAPATKAPVKAKPAPAKPVVRWLPTGTGMWLHEWRKSEQGHAYEVVKRAQSAGLTHLYVQTGSSKKGWIGSEVLGQLLPATNGTDLKVIAWDFPKLVHPVADATRMARAALYRKDGAPRVAAVAPDVETASEGTYLSTVAIDTYYSTLRRLLPPNIAILPTVPWPSEHRLTRYPYDQTATFADAIVPMAYWYNRSPATVTETSMRVLKRYGKPVMPVGQGYDGRLDAPYLAEDPTPGKSVQAFLDAARAGGAQSVSLWSWQTTGPKQWRVLSEAGRAKAFVPGELPAPTVPWSTKGRKPRR